MKTISVFLLLIYWSIMIFGPFMANDYKQAKNIKIVKKLEINK